MGGLLQCRDSAALSRQAQLRLGFLGGDTHSSPSFSEGLFRSLEDEAEEETLE